MRRNGLFSLIFIVLLAVGGLAGTLVSGNKPLLGLDLQGGVSVVLQPPSESDPEAIRQAIAIIRQRIDGLGVAEPEIARQGDAIVVQLPGVKDRDRALELVGQTAELRFRPVHVPAAPAVGLRRSPPDSTTTTTEAPSTTAGDLTSPATASAPGESAAPVQAGDSTTPRPRPRPPAPPTRPIARPRGPRAPPADDIADESVTLGEYDDDGQRGPALPARPHRGHRRHPVGRSARLEGVGHLGGRRAGQGQPHRRVQRHRGASASTRPPRCPTGQLAIVLDSRVVSAPNINAPSFAADAISISGNFDEGEAKDLALVLRYGSLPVELEPQQTQSISASLGKDALDAGVLAGIIGLALVALYMIVYYRLLGVVAIFSLGVSAALLWTIIAYLGENQGLALTLAGVTGIIVSIGVAVDSNVVFYEHLKEDVVPGPDVANGDRRRRSPRRSRPSSRPTSPRSSAPASSTC